jgi:hypothetical protein
MNITAKRFATAFGAVYLLVGLVGFALTGLSGFAASQGPELVVFQVNPLHNIVHLAVGGAFLGAASAGESAARQISLLIGGVYAVVGVLGLFIAGDNPVNVLALNQADNALHLFTAVAAFGAVAASRNTRRPVTA